MGDARILRQLPRRLSRPDRQGLERAVAAFLEALGRSPLDPSLRDTPRRVAEAWAEHFAEGYFRTPEEAVGELYPAPGGSAGELVVVTGLRFHSMCPHHLLPYQGRAHLAYVPAKGVVGFGRLRALLDVFAHRLSLQEDLAREVARELARVLSSPATACIIDAEQACLRVRRGCEEARTHTEAYEGRFRRNRALRAELWARIGARR